MSQNQNQNNNNDDGNVGVMNVGNTNLDVLPPIPEGTTRLYCSGNNLTELPELPEGLEVVICSYNKITALPDLPSSVRSLTASNNQLTALPALPEALEDLSCGTNAITELPVLPEKLQVLVCNSNQLVELPKLPKNLELVYCHTNGITTIPKLPKTLVDVNFDENPLEEPFARFYKDYKDSVRYNANGFSSGNIKQFIKDVNEFLVEQGVENNNVAIEDLKVKRANYETNAITMEDFQNGEIVSVLYSANQHRNLQNGNPVNIKPSMVFKKSSVRQLSQAAQHGRIKNPLTREDVAHQQTRRLKFENGNAAVAAAAAAAAKGGKRKSKKSRKTRKTRKVRKARKHRA
jgi:hypothetical protein